MVENVTGMRVSGMRAQRGWSKRMRVVGMGVIAFVVAAVLLLGVALHDGGATRTDATVASATTTNQRSFPPVNATLLPQGKPAAPYMEDFTPAYGQNR
ncbi:MAG: hypothetical protein ACYDAR_17225 [Thermomicrobiales bacterium]